MPVPVVATLGDLQHFRIPEQPPMRYSEDTHDRPWICSASAAERNAMSQADIFAMLVSLRLRFPRCNARAVEWTSSRVVSTPTTISVILDCTIWKLAMVLPNASRTWARGPRFIEAGRGDAVS